MSDENNTQLEAMLAELSPTESSRLILAAQKVGIAALEKFGVAVPITEILGLPQVRASTLSAGIDPDISNCMYLLEHESPTVRGMMAASAIKEEATQAVLSAGETPTSLTALDISKMPASVRPYLSENMSYERLAELPSSLRLTVARYLPDPVLGGTPVTPKPREATQAQAEPAPTDSQTRNAVPPHRQLNDAAARMDAARAGAK